jgi:hypothetical protein
MSMQNKIRELVEAFQNGLLEVLNEATLDELVEEPKRKPGRPKHLLVPLALPAKRRGRPRKVDVQVAPKGLSAKGAAKPEKEKKKRTVVKVTSTASAEEFIKAAQKLAKKGKKGRKGKAKSEEAPASEATA